jgi:hypothetical protein
MFNAVVIALHERILALEGQNTKLNADLLETAMLLAEVAGLVQLSDQRIRQLENHKCQCEVVLGSIPVSSTMNINVEGLGEVDSEKIVEMLKKMTNRNGQSPC